MHGGKYSAVIGRKIRFFRFLLLNLTSRLWRLCSHQSHRRISPWSSNHGISPNDSVKYSGWLTRMRRGPQVSCTLKNLEFKRQWKAPPGGARPKSSWLSLICGVCTVYPTFLPSKAQTSVVT